MRGKKINVMLLLLMVTILSSMSLIIAATVVYFIFFLIYGVTRTNELFTQPIVIGMLLTYLAWRIHLNYNKLKTVIIEDTDKFNDMMRKYYQQNKQD